MQQKLENLQNSLNEKNLNYRIGKYDVKANYNLASKSLGIPLEAIAKTMILKSEDKQYLVCVLPNAKKIDYEKIETNTDIRYKLADEKTCEKLTNCKIGAITPLLLDSAMDIVIDKSVMHYKEIRNCKWSARI